MKESVSRGGLHGEPFPPFSGGGRGGGSNAGGPSQQAETTAQTRQVCVARGSRVGAGLRAAERASKARHPKDTPTFLLALVNFITLCAAASAALKRGD